MYACGGKAEAQNDASFDLVNTSWRSSRTLVRIIDFNNQQFSEIPCFRSFVAGMILKQIKEGLW
jgi:hypothetical protein